ncbi:hypothetical protein AB6A23_13490 [Paenibacillus tarimensis]
MEEYRNKDFTNEDESAAGFPSRQDIKGLKHKRHRGCRLSKIGCFSLTFISELLEILTPALERSLAEQQHEKSIIEMVKWIMMRNNRISCI